MMTRRPWKTVLACACAASFALGTAGGAMGARGLQTESETPRATTLTEPTTVMTPPPAQPEAIGESSRVSLGKAVTEAEGPENEPEAETPETPTTPEGTLWIGDSVSVLSEASIKVAFPDVTLNAVSGRTTPEATADSGAWQGWSGRRVVIELGANDPTDKETFKRDYEALLATLPEDVETYLVTIQVTGTFHDMHNEALTEIAQGRGRTHVVDWDAFSEGHPEWFSDNVHPTMDEGTDALAACILEGVRAVEG